MTDMHPYEALKIALQEARDERDDWRESATRAAGESCGDERHCTCVGPLRKELRDAKAKLAALVAACEMALDIDSEDVPVDAFHDKWKGAPGYGNGDGSREILSKALAAAKVQP